MPVSQRPRHKMKTPKYIRDEQAATTSIESRQIGEAGDHEIANAIRTLRSHDLLDSLPGYNSPATTTVRRLGRRGRIGLAVGGLAVGGGALGALAMRRRRKVSKLYYSKSLSVLPTDVRSIAAIYPTGRYVSHANRLHHVRHRATSRTNELRRFGKSHDAVVAFVPTGR